MTEHTLDQDASTSETADLRVQNRERTRRLVIEAYAELSLEQGLRNFTMQEIADRAGISHRTLYRYFDDREAILAALEEDVASEVRDSDSDLSDDPAEVIRHNYRVFGEYRKPMMVTAYMLEMGMIDSPPRRARTERMRGLVEEHAPGLDELGRRQLLGVLRLVAGATAWARLTSDEIGLGDDDAGAASAWALKALIEAAASHQGDFS